MFKGGDGLFGEVLNGLLARRHKTTPAPKPRTVSDLVSEPAPSSMPSQESQTVILKEPEAEVLLGTEGSYPNQYPCKHRFSLFSEVLRAVH